MKKFLFVLVATALILLCACGVETKTVHCDNCEKEFEIEASSNMDDSWTVYCSDCEKALGLDTIID